MRKLFLFFLIFKIFLFSYDYQYSLDISYANKELLEVIKKGYFKFISGKTKVNDIKIIDENNNECEILGVNYLKNEIEVLFKPSDNLNYKVYLGYKEKSSYKNFKKGQILIDDYLPPNAIKSGIWIWEQKSLSGIYSHTNKDGFSFHRANFAKQFPIVSDDKIVGFVYIEEGKPIKEIIVEVISRYRKHYYFSFGEDEIKIKGISKEKLGELPEKGKWVKIEIPLTKIREKNIEGLGFYNDSGKVYWDRFSINEVPVEFKIKKVINLKDRYIPYFNYEVEGPFKIKDKKITILKLDGSPSTLEEYLWEIDGKIFNNEKFEIIIEKDEKEIEVKLKNKKGKESAEFIHKINLGIYELKDININFDILPFENFVYENEIIYIPLRIENMSNIPLEIELNFLNEKNKISLFPGKDNGKTITVPINLSGNVEFLLLFKNIEIGRKTIVPISPLEKDYQIDGVFCKKNNSFLVFKIPEYLNLQKSQKNPKIYIIGDYPDSLPEIFEGKNIKIEFFNLTEYQYVNYLLYEFKFIQEIIEKIEEDSYVVLFPFLNSLLRRHKIGQWSKVYEVIFYILTLKTSNIFIFSPYPSYPELNIFLPYRNKLKEIAEKRNLRFIDIYDIFGKIKDSERYFKINDYVYRNKPDKQGTLIIFDSLMQLISETNLKEGMKNGKASSF
ncbi:MAG: hypothetical protein NC915_05260 [Candidatus Omnitrophica bacterium]|nr:hypothetical protein [Candidatus Omnitrophota bacterium]